MIELSWQENRLPALYLSIFPWAYSSLLGETEQKISLKEKKISSGFNFEILLEKKNRMEYRSWKFVFRSLNCVWLFVTPWTAACQASFSYTVSQRLLKFMSIELVMYPIIFSSENRQTLLNLKKIPRQNERWYHLSPFPCPPTRNSEHSCLLNPTVLFQ